MWPHFGQCLVALFISLGVAAPALGYRSRDTPWQDESQCGLQNARRRTVPNRMINIKRSFANGAKELQFIRAANLEECGDVCCDLPGCDTVMFIGPKAAVWKAHARAKLTKGNCALLQCRHGCIVDGAKHYGIHIAKLMVSKTAEEPTDWPSDRDYHPYIARTTERATTTPPATTVKVTTQPATTTAIPATTIPTTTAHLMEAITTRVEVVQATTKLSASPKTTNPTDVQSRKATVTPDASSVIHLSTSHMPQKASTVVRSSTVSEATSIYPAVIKQDANNSAIADAVVNIQIVNNKQTDSNKTSIESKLDATAASATTANGTANSRFSSTPALIIVATLGAIVFLAVLYMAVRQWIAVARNRLRKPKEDYLINGMYA